jgi:hypothetical protein
MLQKIMGHARRLHCAASTSISGSGWGKRPGVSDDDVAARTALRDLVRDD